MRRFYSSEQNFEGTSVHLDTDETRHLRDVLRLRAGDEAFVFDGAGREFRCKVHEIGKKSAELIVIEEVAPTAPESPFELTLAATILNGEKYDLVVQKSVELGVRVLQPIHTLRSEVKLKDAEKRMERWRRIALEATKQSGRATIMAIEHPIEFDELVAGARNENVVLFSERDGADLAGATVGKKITALIGPKGGWDDSELEAARSSGVSIITLGGRILRAETASIAITAILQHRFGDIN
jgi:16S rRNA (uracil1498-N3)-methyltransferase